MGALRHLRFSLEGAGGREGSPSFLLVCASLAKPAVYVS